MVSLFLFLSLPLSRKATGRGERIRCMPQIGSNIYAIGMITALRDYVRLLRAIPMLTLSSHHQHPPPPLFSPPYLSRPTSTSSMTSRINGKSGLLNDRSRDTHCSRWPCNFRLEDLPASFAPCSAPFFRLRSLLRGKHYFCLHTRPPMLQCSYQWHSRLLFGIMFGICIIATMQIRGG